MAANIGDSPFLDEDGRVRLARSAVLLVDLLGVRAVSQASPLDGLRGLEAATRRMFRDFVVPESPWPSAFFSDTLVITSPLSGPEPEEAALGGLIIQGAYLQLNLIEADWFLRGGLTLGDMHLREGLVYGPALIEVHELESRRAVEPRIVLSDTAADSQRRALGFYAQPEYSPEHLLLLADDDGLVFVDYLSLLFDEPDDPRPSLRMHRDRIVSRLGRHRAERRIWDNRTSIG
jgi:hypothetical protein